MDRCEQCGKEFRSFKVPFNGGWIDSKHCHECRAKKIAELASYKKPQQSKKKDA
jgi:hypothetical protein